MKRILIVLALIAAGHKGWEHYQQPRLEPLQGQPYLVVYGRDSCGITQALLADLRRSGIRFQYALVDDPAVADVLHRRMASAGIDTRSYGLPVVDLNNAISVRPEPQRLIQEARRLSL